MRGRSYSPLTLCFTGFTWLTLGSILGLAILIGLVRGTPLPSWVRSLHVHATLIGGVAQILLGGLLLLVAPPESKANLGSDSRPFTFWALNGGVIGMLVGFWLHHDLVVGIAGFAVIAGFLSLIRGIWMRARPGWNSSVGPSWYYALLFFGLVGGSICGALLAFGIFPESHGYVRLAHIHLVVLGFMTLALIDMMQQILPTVWNTTLAHPRLVRFTTIFLAIGVVALISGFLNSSVLLEMIAGTILFVSVGLLIGNLFGTWLSSSHTGSAASDHLLVSTFFLLFTVLLGILIGANNLSSPPRLPYGTLHLVAYTHMAFVGFIMNAMIGACSHLLPNALAARRVAGHKKRALYCDQLTTIMNRGRSLQVATLSLGTMGIGILATLTWNVPLSSIYIHTTMWTCFILLLASFLLFAIKLTTMVAKQPEPLASSHHESSPTASPG
ncbi:MAG: cbb3-type cytochrome c oxidase subunit I [Nitrospira sp.]|nr:cbb3-type cytochrome c oxidase subunit I [Nitrospira sp.]